MTASFLEQMLTIYTHLGMLSRGKYSLSSPLVGGGVSLGEVQTFAGRPRIPLARERASSIPPPTGEGRIPADGVHTSTQMGETGSEAFAEKEEKENGPQSCRGLDPRICRWLPRHHRGSISWAGSQSCSDGHKAQSLFADKGAGQPDCRACRFRRSRVPEPMTSRTLPLR